MVHPERYVLLCSLVAAGCGGAPSAGGWNNGNTPGVAGTGQQPFQPGQGGGNRMVVCPGAMLQQRWAQMVGESIRPTRFAAGLDLAGGDTWQGLTLSQAEQVNCQSHALGDVLGDGTRVSAWGDADEVQVDYSAATEQITSISLRRGYGGTIELTSRDGMQHYSIGVGVQITKNGAPYQLDWNGPSSTQDAKFNLEINELRDALAATFAPGLPPDAACQISGSCVATAPGDRGHVYFPNVGVDLWVATTSAPQPAPSTIDRIDLHPQKLLAYSLANPFLKLDMAGPLALAGTLGASTTPCNLQLGLPFDMFLTNCVKVAGDPMIDQAAENQLLGGISHDTETFQFALQGTYLQFADGSLPANDVVHDGDRPQPGDLAVRFHVDQDRLGKILNDRVGNVVIGPRDIHGAGLVYLEYARLVQDSLNRHITAINQHALGDAACLTGFGLASDIDVSDPNNLVFPTGCTGFEGFVTAAPPTGDPQLDRLAIGTFVRLIDPLLTRGLQPGHPQAAFCLDANGNVTSGYSLCTAPLGAEGDLFATSLQRVVQVLGSGNVNNLPEEARDVRFYWKQYFSALVKYLMVAGTANETPAGVHAATLDADNLYFQAIGTSSLETSVYVDRTFASTSQAPTVVRVTADVASGLIVSYDISRDLYRGETALYTSVLENPGDGIGQETTTLLTNLFGSPVLANGWQNAPSVSAYYCATHLDPGPCGGLEAPHDPTTGAMLLSDSNLPLLTRYQGAFGATAFALGPTTIKVTQTDPAIAQATIRVPIHQNPYDPLSGLNAPLDILVPWIPKQPGVGFPIAQSGALDRFVSASRLDLGGNTLDARVYYDVIIDPNTHQPMANGAIQLLAVESGAFQGDVFPCQDPQTADLLVARMYTPVGAVLDWLEKHPAASRSCGIVVQRSGPGSEVESITSLTNGVRLGFSRGGGGGGRVSDVILFVPGQ
jgi:hypothetical protein